MTQLIVRHLVTSIFLALAIARCEMRTARTTSEDPILASDPTTFGQLPPSAFPTEPGASEDGSEPMLPNGVTGKRDLQQGGAANALPFLRFPTGADGSGGAFSLVGGQIPNGLELRDFFATGSTSAPILPLVGDWFGEGRKGVGYYRRADSRFELRSAVSRRRLSFQYGAPDEAYRPIAGDWNGDGVDTIGLYNRNTSGFFLKNTNSAGPGDLVYQFGAPNEAYVPIVGDWDGDGTDTVGLYNRVTSYFFLRFVHAPGVADVFFQFGAPKASYSPIAGDWDGDGDDNVGLFDFDAQALFFRYENAPGYADEVVRLQGGVR